MFLHTDGTIHYQISILLVNRCQTRVSWRQHRVHSRPPQAFHDSPAIRTSGPCRQRSSHNTFQWLSLTSPSIRLSHLTPSISQTQPLGTIHGSNLALLSVRHPRAISTSARQEHNVLRPDPAWGPSFQPLRHQVNPVNTSFLAQVEQTGVSLADIEGPSSGSGGVKTDLGNQSQTMSNQQSNTAQQYDFSQFRF